MGKIIEYNVTLYPAKCERGYVVTSFEIGSNIEYPGLRFEADSVKAMLARVTAFATTHGKPCNASVRCLASRKPAGFDKATKGLYCLIGRRPILVKTTTFRVVYKIKRAPEAHY